MVDDTAYDRVRYPSLIFPQTHPDRLAVLARLAGLDPVLPAEARVLEIGGGDCLNTLTFAASHPGAMVCGFDLSRAAIADGQALIAGAGLANAELVVEDILDARQRYAAGSFDYVVAHGVYAWVPPAVREATMALIGHVLSDRGVAFVSFNLSAGGHIRQYLREMLEEHLRGVVDPAQRLEKAREHLAAFSRSSEDHGAVVAALREQAEKLLAKIPEVLHHDELSDCYYPQSLRQFAEAASSVGLRFLTDAGPQRSLDGFIPESAPEPADQDEQVIQAAHRDDFATARFFRQGLLVRAGQPIRRRIDPDRLDGLFISARLTRDEDGDLVGSEGRVTLMDDGLADRIAALAPRYPERVPLATIAPEPDQRRAVLQLFAGWLVSLHVEPLPFPLSPGERPRASGLVRQRISEGAEVVPTLDCTLLRVGQPEMRQLLLAADGTRTVAELAAMDHGISGDQIAGALNAAARLGLIAG